jgi:hypothetical protein
VEGGLEDPDEPEPEEEDPPVDVDPEVLGGLEEDPDVVGGLEEDPDVVGGGLEVVGGEGGGGAKRRTGVFAEILKEVAAYVAAMMISERSERILLIQVLCI